MGYIGKQHAEYALNTYHQLMKEAKEYLGGCCVVCGTTENLEFDHVDPTTKEFTISHGWSLSAERFWIEVNKCQLLCREHHSDKTKTEEYNLGESNGNSKLREFDVKYIRELYRLGHGQRSLAREFDVSRPTIKSVLSGETWKSIDDEPIILRINEKLTKEDVLEIRYLASAGLTLSAIGLLFDIGKSHVSMVVRRKIWADI